MRWLAYKGIAWFLRLLFAPFVRVRVLHAERTSVTGACILACNHISHFDPPLIAARIRRKVDWMAMAELFSNRLFGAALRFIDTFPVERSRSDRASVRITLERLKRGHVVGIFPEGGIRDGAASVLGGAPPVPGVGALAQISGAPVLPCVILGSDRLYAKRSYVPFRRVTVWIGFGDLLHCESGEKPERASLDNRLAEAMRALQREMTDRFHLTADDLPKSPRERIAAR
jgi:1-acyl-sn-glycerol-3-phosphate acyltransferase